MKHENFYGATILWSEKADGNMRNNGENVLKFLRNSNVPEFAPYIPVLQHGNQVVKIGPGFYPHRAAVDALITDKKDIALAVGFADCPTVFLVDPPHHAIGIAHCGWKGVSKGIIHKVIEQMIIEYGSKPVEMRAMIGPGIAAENYPVGTEVGAMYFPSNYKGGKLDLQGVIERHLVVNGVPIICLTNEDTFSELAPSGDYKYFSGRRDKFPLPELKTNMAFIYQ